MSKPMKDIQPLIAVDRLGFRYENGRPLFADLSFELLPGETLAIIGKSGCGKTSLAYCLCGIIPHIYHGELTGSVTLRGESLQALKPAHIAQQIGIVFQSPDIQLFSDYIEEDIVFGMENLCFEHSEMEERLGEVAELLRIEELIHERAGHLSGGQQQLAAIASVLVMGSEVLVLDEAMSQLDREGKQLICSALAALKSAGKSIVLIEHDPEILQLADKVINLDEMRQ